MVGPPRLAMACAQSWMSFIELRCRKVEPMPGEGLLAVAHGGYGHRTMGDVPAPGRIGMTLSRDKLVMGALAGFAATLPMTVAMHRLHEQLPLDEQYPLPPRELSEDLPALGLSRSTATLVYHFLYGAAAGSALAVVSDRRDAPTGAFFGAAVWMASYLGWIPAAGRLKSGTRHPARRNGLMLAAHLVWGACLAAGLGGLERARTSSFARSSSPNPHLKDRPEASQ